MCGGDREVAEPGGWNFPSETLKKLFFLQNNLE